MVSAELNGYSQRTFATPPRKECVGGESKERVSWRWTLVSGGGSYNGRSYGKGLRRYGEKRISGFYPFQEKTRIAPKKKE